MRLILIRHALRDHEFNEAEAPLTEAGRKKAVETSVKLQDEKAKADVVLSSKQRPSKDTANVIFPNAHLVDTDLLNPESNDDNPDWSKLSAEMIRRHGKSKTVAIVGHHPAIANLLRSVTGEKKIRRIGFGEAIVVIGLQKNNVANRGRVKSVFGADDASESPRQKIELKMTVCTFLAGFTIPVLVELLKDPPVDLLKILSTVAFACSLALLVAAIFIFDLLLMPSNFWGPINKNMKPKRSRRKFYLDYLLNGALYAYMVRTWKWFFGVALFLVIPGVLLLVFNGYVEKRLDRQSATVVLSSGIIIAVIGAAILYRVLRPKLGIED